jgi:hypothetical protein
MGVGSSFTSICRGSIPPRFGGDSTTHRKRLHISGRYGGDESIEVCDPIIYVPYFMLVFVMLFISLILSSDDCV